MAQKRNEFVPFTFTHPDRPDTVVVTAPRRIVLSIGQVIGTLRLGLQPLNVKPIDWFGFVRIFIPLLPVALVTTVFNDFVGLIVIVIIGALLDMGRVVRVYYRDVMRRYLSVGYVLSDPSLEEALRESGTLPLPGKGVRTSDRTRIIAYVVGTALLFGTTIFIGGNATVAMVRDSYLNVADLPRITVGEAAEQNLLDPEWSHLTTDDGGIYVNLEGVVSLDDGERFPIIFQFAVDPEAEIFEINAIELDGEPVSDWEVFIALAFLYGL